jgi:hypothetical protein
VTKFDENPVADILAMRRGSIDLDPRTRFEPTTGDNPAEESSTRRLTRLFATVN